MICLVTNRAYRQTLFLIYYKFKLEIAINKITLLKGEMYLTTNNKYDNVLYNIKRSKVVKCEGDKRQYIKKHETAIEVKTEEK